MKFRVTRERFDVVDSLMSEDTEYKWSIDSIGDIFDDKVQAIAILMSAADSFRFYSMQYDPHADKLRMCMFDMERS